MEWSANHIFTVLKLCTFGCLEDHRSWSSAWPSRACGGGGWHTALTHLVTFRLWAARYFNKFAGREGNSPNVCQNFHSWCKKLSPARNDVLEAEGWSAPCAEVAFRTRFREVKTTRCCLRSTINQPLPGKCPQFKDGELPMLTLYSGERLIQNLPWKSTVNRFTRKDWVRAQLGCCSAEGKEVARICQLAPPCLLCAAQGRPQGAGWGAGPGPRAPCQGPSQRPRRSPAVSYRWKVGRVLIKFTPNSGLGGPHHGVLHWPWRSSLPRGPSWCHKEVGITLNVYFILSHWDHF